MADYVSFAKQIDYFVRETNMELIWRADDRAKLKYFAYIGATVTAKEGEWTCNIEKLNRDAVTFPNAHGLAAWWVAQLPQLELFERLAIEGERAESLAGVSVLIGNDYLHVIGPRNAENLCVYSFADIQATLSSYEVADIKIVLENFHISSHNDAICARWFRESFVGCIYRNCPVFQRGLYVAAIGEWFFTRADMSWPGPW